MIKPAKHGRDHARGGEDPIPFGLPYIEMLSSGGSITAGVHSDDNVAVPHHPDYLTWARGDGMELTGDGGVWIRDPNEGLFAVDIALSWNTGGWTSFNHYLVCYLPLIPFHGATPLAGLNAILGSAFGPSTLEHGQSHNGAGKVVPTDIRKPELAMNFRRTIAPAGDSGLGVQQGWAFFPTLYTETPNASWDVVIHTCVTWINDRRLDLDV